MNGIGRERIDLNGTELDWKGRGRPHLKGLDRIKLDWGKHQRSGLDWTKPDNISED